MKDTLNARFRAPLPDYYARRIIVWKDEAGEFADTVAEMTLENARILTMGRDNLFQLRRQIEVDYAAENLLLYCPLAFEKPQDNGLLDVFLYSEEFRADYWSLLFDELRIQNTRATRDYAQSISGFFKSRERRAKLAALHTGYENEDELRTGVFGVLCGARAYGMNEAARLALACPPEEENPALEAMAKFCGEDALWDACRAAYGYGGDHDPERLACYLLATAAMNNAQGTALPGLPANALYAQAAYGFFADWLHADREGLMALCQRTEERFRISNILEALPREELLRVNVFPAADRLLLEAALNGFAEGHFNLDAAEALLRQRQDQPWAAEFAPYYAAVRALMEMQRFYQAYHGGFHFTALAEMWQAYGQTLYQMDGHYRAFCTAYDRALSLGLMALEDALKAASDAAERLYRNWYLNGLNQRWTQLLFQQGLGAIRGVGQQRAFYRDCIVSADTRVYVIISDGLRYETGRELANHLTGKLSGNTECGCMQATLPSVTAVGMAALLPHQRLAMDDGMKIRCDGLSADAPNREAVLRAACSESLAVDYTEFRRLNRTQRGELVKGKKVIYIYHNAIDRAGESDGNVFEACEDAINELTQLMRILTGEMNAVRVLITADHGFIYTRTPLEEYDKTGKEALQGDIMEYKRRHAIVRGAVSGDTLQLALDPLSRPDLTAAFPNGCMRFRIQGGAETYMHGGPTLQELMIPLIRYQSKKAGQKGYTAITKVELALVGDKRKISNNIFTLNFYQTQPCGGKMQPRTILARFEDEAGGAVSDTHRIVCDLTAAENRQRVLPITFRLLGSGYDRTAAYALVLQDVDEKTPLMRIPFQIDIVFGNDFGF